MGWFTRSREANWTLVVSRTSRDLGKWDGRPWSYVSCIGHLFRAIGLVYKPLHDKRKPFFSTSKTILGSRSMWLQRSFRLERTKIDFHYLRWTFHLPSILEASLVGQFITGHYPTRAFLHTCGLAPHLVVNLAIQWILEAILYWTDFAFIIFETVL